MAATPAPIADRELELMAMSDDALLDVVNRSLETLEATDKLGLSPLGWIRRNEATLDLGMARAILDSRT